MPTEDKRRGKLLPSPVVPADTVCFTIQVPNAVQYRAAFLAQISILGEWQTWDHPIDGTVCDDCEVAAQLWRNALYEAVWSDECGGSMSCDDVADCIETSEAVQQALAAQAANNPAQQQIINYTATYGTPLSQAQRTASLGTVPDCDYGILFAMCTAIIDQLNTNNEDFLQILEAATNNAERAQNVVSAIPVVGLLPVDEAIEFIDQLVEEIQENYLAQYTTSVRDELRCALFCAAKEAEDCIISFDMLTKIFEDRLNYYLDPVHTVEALVQYFVSGTWAGTTVVDIMTLIQVAFWREASNWLGVNIRTLQIVARLAFDNPDPDWEILCEDCNQSWEKCWNTETETLPFMVVLGSYVPGVGYVDAFLQTANGYRGIALSYSLNVITTLQEAVFEFEMTAGTLNTDGDKTAYFAFESVPYVDIEVPNVPTSPQEGDVFVEGNDLFLQLLSGASVGIGDPGGSVVLKSLCLRGNGPEPSWT